MRVRIPIPTRDELLACLMANNRSAAAEIYGVGLKKIGVWVSELGLVGHPDIAAARRQEAKDAHTPRQVMAFIARYQEEHGYPPLLKEIGKACGLSSHSAVSEWIARLVKDGYLAREPHVTRGIKILKMLDGQVTASASQRAAAKVEVPVAPPAPKPIQMRPRHRNAEHAERLDWRRAVHQQRLRELPSMFGGK